MSKFLMSNFFREELMVDVYNHDDPLTYRSYCSIHFSCFSDCTDPGRSILILNKASSASKSRSLIRYAASTVPVLPLPAAQCTKTGLPLQICLRIYSTVSLSCSIEGAP